MLATGGVLAVCIERLLHSRVVPHPHGGLVVVALFAAVLLGTLALRAQRATKRGFIALRALRKARRLAVLDLRHPPRRAPTGLDLPFALALLGAPAVMADPRFAGIELAVGREGLRQGDASASGCSTGGDGGGGGGCGGGCGGCGG